MAVSEVVTNGADPLALIGTVVTPVTVVVLFLTGFLHTRSEVRRLEEALAAKDATITRQQEQIDALQNGLIDKAIPALTRATTVLDAISPLITTEPRLRHSEGP